MADVIQLPSAAPCSIGKQRRYGPYRSKGNIRPISTQRVKRRMEESANQAQTDKLSAREVAECEQRMRTRLRQANWPFPDIGFQSFDQLTEMQKGEIQWKVREMIQRFEAAMRRDACDDR